MLIDFTESLSYNTESLMSVIERWAELSESEERCVLFFKELLKSDELPDIVGLPNPWSLEFELED